MSKFVMIAGTKGGIGKTLIATFLADIASEHGFRPVLFDCDNENHSLSNACGGVPEFELADIDPESAEETDYPLDSAVNRIAELESAIRRCCQNCWAAPAPDAAQCRLCGLKKALKGAGDE